VPTHGIHCRSFAIDPSARMLVAASVAPMAEREGETIRVITAGLSVFAMDGEGGLTFIRKYDVPPGAGAVFWCGMRQLG
jgi:6-phosphogluconolactonase (cycloisomerase 2 family)